MNEAINKDLEKFKSAQRVKVLLFTYLKELRKLLSEEKDPIMYIQRLGRLNSALSSSRMFKTMQLELEEQELYNCMKAEFLK